ncbi:MAG: heavy-metal-associated domain-containing protein [Bacteroidales bacterium]
MKTKILSIVTMLILSLVSVADVSAQTKSKKESKKETVVYETVLHCKDCEDKIMKNIAFEKGVTDISTNLGAQMVKIEYRKDKTDKTKLASAMNKIGFQVKEVAESDVKTKEGACCGGHDHDHKK